MTVQRIPGPRDYRAGQLHQAVTLQQPTHTRCCALGTPGPGTALEQKDHEADRWGVRHGDLALCSLIAHDAIFTNVQGLQLLRLVGYTEFRFAELFGEFVAPVHLC